VTPIQNQVGMILRAFAPLREIDTYNRSRKGAKPEGQGFMRHYSSARTFPVAIANSF
jgi:hypothetical protein